MRRNGNILMTKSARLRRIAFIFLALISHSLFVNITHHHALKPVSNHGVVPAVTQDRHTPAEHLPQAHSEHCATCTLQRHAASQENSPVYTISLAQQDANRESLLLDRQHQGAHCTDVGRAPPLL